ncbi:MAG TPA: phage holin [Thermoanaerobacterium sp.]|nr:phage holin [Thermoanaerobacterium sp.]
MKDLIMTILTAGLQLVILATLGYVINYLYSKIGTEKTKRYFEIAKMIVRGVEQEFGAGNGADKKAEAVNLIKKIVGNKLTDEEIDKLNHHLLKQVGWICRLSSLKLA